jgi:hypothetical protein
MSRKIAFTNGILYIGMYLGNGKCSVSQVVIPEESLACGRAGFFNIKHSACAKKELANLDPFCW